MRNPVYSGQFNLNAQADTLIYSTNELAGGIVRVGAVREPPLHCRL